MQLVRRMEWRPLLLYAYPLGHRVTEIFRDYIGKNTHSACTSPSYQ